MQARGKEVGGKRLKKGDDNEETIRGQRKQNYSSHAYKSQISGGNLQRATQTSAC